MDKTEDVLVLLMTSHGAANGVALQLPGKAVAVLTPQEVATVLDKEGIKNRVVIVSACYSGVFVKPLADDNSIVLTAADEKNTSFGCAPGRDWTYFGDALFNQSLQPGVDLRYAFGRARLMIAGWEQHGSRQAVKSAGALRSESGRQACAGLRGDAERQPVTPAVAQDRSLSSSNRIGSGRGAARPLNVQQEPA